MLLRFRFLCRCGAKFRASWLLLTVSTVKYTCARCEFDFSAAQRVLKFTTSDCKPEACVLAMARAKLSGQPPIADCIQTA